MDTTTAEIFNRFPINTAPEASGYHCDFSGARFRTGFAPSMGEGVNYAYPAPDEEYFEWIDLLESLEGATGEYVMFELGAGFGRWSSRAGCLARSRGITSRIVAVEAEPVHFKWLQENFLDNNLEASLVHGAVTATGGTAHLCIDGEPDAWYGQEIVSADSSRKSVQVPAYTLNQLLDPFSKVDLIDLDIQGAEFDVLSASIEALNAKVKRIHVGTHSPNIEDHLRELFKSLGWRCIGDYRQGSTTATPYGLITFEDGVQSWVNPT